MNQGVGGSLQVVALEDERPPVPVDADDRAAVPALEGGRLVDELLDPVRHPIEDARGGGGAIPQCRAERPFDRLRHDDPSLQCRALPAAATPGFPTGVVGGIVSRPPFRVTRGAVNQADARRLDWAAP